MHTKKGHTAHSSKSWGQVEPTTELSRQADGVVRVHESRVHESRTNEQFAPGAVDGNAHEMADEDNHANREGRQDLRRDARY